MSHNRIFMWKRKQRDKRWWSNFSEYFQPLRYLSKLTCFVYYSCMNLWKITSKYSLRPLLEYLYLGQIPRLFAESKQISSSYSFFWPFVGQSWIIIRLWCNADLYTWITRIFILVITQKWPKLDFQYSIFASKMAKFWNSIFDICFEVEYLDLKPSISSLAFYLT